MKRHHPIIRRNGARVPAPLRTLAIREGIDRLHAAREHFAIAGAPRAYDAVLRALKSAEGAERNAQCREARQEGAPRP